ncbi:MAG: glycosyltransferase family 1 protein [Lachnospiraceae bacterium]|nr:glycosyltransferase family 1 protein [Lachnospiraceae bacterium]
MQEPIRVLHVFGGLSLGGAESRVMDLYRHIDREKLQFDFLVHSAGEDYFDKELKELGGRIYRVPRFKFYNWLEYRKALKSFFSEHSEFRAVHGHMTSTASIYLPIAKKTGIPITIAHARSAGVPAGIKGVLTKWLRRSLKNKTDYCLACSKEAGEAVFGKECMRQGMVEVIPNAIAAPQYVYNPEMRRCMRQELQMEDKLIIGHVGSFRTPKNHVFLLKIFGEIRRRREDAVLLLLGEGELQEKIKELAEREGLKESVLFLGNRSPVSDYYQAMDFLVFPSIFEGLPGTVIEAQTAGLRCLISDAISGEVKITDLVKAYSLEDSAAEWAEYVLANCEYERQSRLEEVSAAGFDISEQIKRYERIYGIQ